MIVIMLVDMVGGVGLIVNPDGSTRKSSDRAEVMDILIPRPPLAEANELNGGKGASPMAPLVFD